MDVSTRLGLGRLAPAPSRSSPQNPLMNPYRAGDDRWFWLIGAKSERHSPVSVLALGRPDLADDAQFRTPRDRRCNAQALMQVLDEVFAQRTRREWAEIFAQRDVWWAPVNSIDDLLSDPQVAAAGAFVPPVPDHGEEGDPPRTLATLVDFGASPVGPAGPPPELGEHTDAVLRSIGIDERELGRLRREGVVG